MWVICISLLVFLVFLLLPLRIKVGVRIELKNGEINIALSLGVGRLYINNFNYRLGWESIEKIVGHKKWGKKRKKLNIGNLKKIYQKLPSLIFIENFSWETVLGLDNAAYTAWATGYLWMVKGIFINFFSHLLPIKKIYVNIRPDFMEGNKNTRIFCIVRIPMAHIILIGIYLVYLKVRRFSYGTERK